MKNILFLLTIVIAKSQAFIKVGNDAQCDFTTIADAKTQATVLSDFELRIATNKTYFENLSFDSVPISLIGGFANCTDAQSNTLSPSKTKIDGSSLFKPVIVLENINSVAIEISFKNLEITNGLGNIIAPSGGINIKDVDAQVNFENLYLHNNSSEKGGAIYSTRFDSTGDLNLIFMKDIDIDSNMSIDGGGLYCTESQIYIYGNSVIQSNQALGPGGGSRDGEGGGIYATANCKINFYSGNLNFTQGIVSNTANGSGGGIYASGAAQIVLDGYQVNNLGIQMGDATNPVNITNNITNFHDGAAIYIEGSNTNVTAFASIINFNEAAGSYGGAVAVNNSASFSLLRKLENCWDNYLCNQMSANKVFSSQAFPSYGGAISAQNLAIVTINQSIIKQNQAEFGTAIALNNAILSMQSSMVYKNGQNGNVNNLQDKSVIYLTNSSTASLALSTFANNQVTGSVLENISSNLYVLSSILIDAVDINQATTVINEMFSCLVTHEQASFTGTNINTNAVSFINQTNDDYHLQNTSVGTDMCDSSIFLATTADCDNEIRITMYNAGADETNSFSDLIFKNNFE